MDIGSALLLSTWLVAALLAVSRGAEWGWLSSRVLTLALLAVGCGVWWWRHGSVSRSPLIDTALLRMPAVAAANVVALLIGAAMYALLAVLPPYVQTAAASGYGLGASVTRCGLLLLPMAVTTFGAGLVMAPLASRFGDRAAVAFGGLVSALGLLVLSLWIGSVEAIVVASFLTGFGSGLAYAALASMVVQAVPAAQTAVVAAVNANPECSAEPSARLWLRASFPRGRRLRRGRPSRHIGSRS
ncbi:MAG: MFS transporter [Nocardioides sp.]|uniref:hypothetical protein n=1 Tax=Nocardioides sp. TaxID=35761 RepID=UPI0039E32D9C